jgi:hypothetical protein
MRDSRTVVVVHEQSTTIDPVVLEIDGSEIAAADQLQFPDEACGGVLGWIVIAAPARMPRNLLDSSLP